MVCCALLSILIAGGLWLVGRLRRRRDRADGHALAWRPYGRGPGEQPTPAEPAAFTVSARINSAAYAVEGLRFVLRNEHNAWIHAAATVLVVVAGASIGITGADWRWIIIAILWVWCAEVLNTAFEHLCDVVSPGPNDSVRIAKDVAAGAVLVSAIGAAILGAITLMPYIVPLALGSDLDFAVCRSNP